MRHLSATTARVRDRGIQVQSVSQICCSNLHGEDRQPQYRAPNYILSNKYHSCVKLFVSATNRKGLCGAECGALCAPPPPGLRAARRRTPGFTPSRSSSSTSRLRGERTSGPVDRPDVSPSTCALGSSNSHRSAKKNRIEGRCLASPCGSRARAAVIGS